MEDERAPCVYYKLSKGNKVSPSLYPDIAAAGDLSSLLSRALSRIGSLLSASDAQDMPDWFPACARVEVGDRFSQLYVASEHRLFLASYWSQGVQFATGQSASIDEIATSIEYWINNSPLIAEFVANHSFVVPEADAASFEQGRATASRWQSYLRALEPPFADLSAFIHVAFEHPALRGLFPYTSMARFCFSRCTGYPYSRDCPSVAASRPGVYSVYLRDQEEIPDLSAEEAVEVVVRNLPPGTTAAINGTADDL